MFCKHFTTVMTCMGYIQWRIGVKNETSLSIILKKRQSDFWMYLTACGITDPKRKCALLFYQFGSSEVLFPVFSCTRQLQPNKYQMLWRNASLATKPKKLWIHAFNINWLLLARNISSGLCKQAGKHKHALLISIMYLFNKLISLYKFKHNYKS